jgi:hypothetical protein
MFARDKENRMRYAIALLACSLLLIPGCGEKGPRNIGVIIDSVGKHPVNGQYVSYLEVKRNDEGKLRLWFGSANYPSASSDDMDLLEGWFVYAESQARFWAFNGDETLKLWEYSGSPGNATLFQDPHSPDEIPREILPRLPGSLQQNEVAEQDAGGKGE